MIAAMGTIRKLPPELVNQIAAGEVIERPASVVKELVENALDAGARRIEVTLEDGGRGLVRVVDDGSGIAPEDLPLAVESHATSKLARADDLFHVRTLGFRGEALASMGAVADLRVASRGAEIRVRGGEAGEVRPAGVAPGTTVEVRDLFFNVPARRKFLRDGPGELRPAIEALTRLALGAPGVAFRMVHERRLVLETGAARDERERIADLFGREVARDLVPVAGVRGAARLRGFAALPHRTRGDSTLQLVCLNGRPIRDRLVTGAIKEAYHGFLMTRRHPIVFLSLDVEPEAVDVNVHPAKLEVRFREPREVFALVRGAIAEALGSRKEAPALRVRERAPAYLAAGSAAPRRWFPLPAGAPPLPVLAPGRSSTAAPVPGRPSTAGPAPARLSAPGPKEAAPSEHLQLASGYLVVATADGFEVIDPHALHERILYEEWKARLAAGAVEVQQLLLPIVVELSALEEARLERRAPELAALGLAVEPFGRGAAAIQAIPAVLGPRERDWGAILRGLLATEDDGATGPSRDDILDALTATIACKAAVKLGERLSREEVAALLARREAAQRSHLCPHGRPTALRFTASDLERQFKR